MTLSSASHSSAFYQSLLDALEHPVITIDSSRVITTWNRPAEEVFGWKAAEIVGRSIQTLVAADESAHGGIQFTDGPTAAQFQGQLQRKDGLQVLVRMTQSPIYDAEMKLVGNVLLPAVVAEAEEKSITARADDVADMNSFPGQEITEESLYRSERLWRKLLDTLPVGVSVADKHGRVLLSNPTDQGIWMDDAHADLHEYNLHVKAWSMETGQVIRPEDWALSRAVHNGEVTLNQVLEIEPFEGGRKTILNSAAPIRDDQGSIIGGIAVHQDITEQRRMEQAERKHRTFANALSNITAVLTSTLDLQTVMERILDNAGRVVPHEAANIMLIEGDRVRIAFWHNYGPKCDELFRTRQYPLEMPMLKRMLDTGLPQLVRDTWAAPDWVRFEETAWVRSSVGVPIRSRDTILGFLALDSSEPDFFQPPDAERLRAFAYQAAIAIENARLYSTIRAYARELETRVTQRTAELRQAKDHVEAILEHSSDGIALANSTGVITQVNPSFKHLFGFSGVTEDYPALSTLVDANGWERLTRAFDDARLNARSKRIELTCHRLNGKTFDADVAIAPLFDPVQEIDIYVCNVRDVTPQKTAERELRSALAKEKALTELQARFVAIVSHEFRTPLAAIQTSTDLLYGYYDRITAERRGEIIVRIQSQIQRLTGLLEDVLTVAKADTVGLIPDVSRVDLKILCTDVIQELEHLSTTHREIALQTVGESAVAEVDSRLFRQVLVNLLSNALKFSPENSRVELHLEVMTDRIIIRVRDYGIGVPEADMPELFNTFYRASNVGDHEGTGLGLAVVARTVAAHHGTAAVESALGVGTCFTITLPKKYTAPDSRSG
jgi:PAS domain S-box-containing protein